ncbi:MAG: hypothetical protein Q8K82_11310 [Gemmatimonadaceae bacterium]|nr:hypothetical protein [Gemmatimonadaceae bacterium]
MNKYLGVSPRPQSLVLTLAGGATYSLRFSRRGVKEPEQVGQHLEAREAHWGRSLQAQQSSIRRQVLADIVGIEEVSGEQTALVVRSAITREDGNRLRGVPAAAQDFSHTTTGPR